MGINDGMLMVVVAFFALLLYSVHRDDKRNAERRKQSLPHPAERRKTERRRRSLSATLAWAFRSPWSKRTR